ncbi:MAG: bifunctional phosphoribosylaminoimidazolecarboxamide formyltransferase/IMP cyclohydrolase [Dehalococcoidia bacterium]|nr:MAG: bifunctional phosphoribosylaminoimidazolecarboxamide formyltransferase/IMP cyclohydrolase [Dehalococcoidia bacterium]
MRVIISVSDKSGVTEFAQELNGLGFEIFSTGGTKQTLSNVGIAAKSVSEITGFPEILGGRVKTLHPAVHGGLLAKRNLPEHMEELAKHNIQPIDMVVVNLYPFVQTVSKESVTLDDALENIDIGGPTMLRASAKNFPNVIVIVDPADYCVILERLKAGEVSQEERKRLAQKAFQHVAIYDTAISQYLRQNAKELPNEMTIALKKCQDLRYGENPHQTAAFYTEQLVATKQDTGIAYAKKLWGKELSFNNILDADAAWSAVVDFTEPTVAIVKHTNTCGLASHPNIAEAYRRAFSGDTVSAFGGIVAANRTITNNMAEAMKDVFYEIVIAPEYTTDALVVLKKKKNLRILLVKLPADYGGSPLSYLDYRRIKGGILVQFSDSLAEEDVKLQMVTKRKPTAKELEDLLFAWRAVKHIKSNAILLVKDKMIVGMGAGQPNRVVSAEIASKKAGAKAIGSVMASDAMFPFSDTVEQAAATGVTAIIQPGGSIRDADSIKAADSHKIAMVFTGVRHFLH